MIKKLKAPFPAFGGKSAVADLVWSHLGDVANFIEPFANSAAVLLARPHAPRIETLNDLDCYIANFWRATKEDPDSVAEHADGPVNEADLHARHRWLVLSDDAKEFRQRMRTDPHYFDAKVAGWWCWGLCCWIGSGWCSVGAEWEQTPAGQRTLTGVHGGNDLSQQVPIIGDQLRGVHRAVDGPELSSQTPAGQRTLTGVHAKGQDNRKPRIDGGEGQYGHGVHAKGELCEKRPRSASEPLAGTGLPGVHGNPVQNGTLHEKRPFVTGFEGQMGRGVDAAAYVSDTSRPQLGDAYARGRGVHGHDDAGTCAQRRAWLLDWFGRLRDRLRTVRVCCGDWRRVCDSESVTTRLGTTGIFFDAPYKQTLKCGKKNRSKHLYSNDATQNVNQLVDDVIAYCLECGGNPDMRIVAACYEGEGYEVLLDHGWSVIEWKAAGGYGNRSEVGKANARRERLFVSPHCVQAASLFT